MKLIQRHPLPSCRSYDGGSYIEHETPYPTPTQVFPLGCHPPTRSGIEIAYG